MRKREGVRGQETPSILKAVKKRDSGTSGGRKRQKLNKAYGSGGG